MRYLANRIIRWPDELGYTEACRQQAHVVRLQEEMGSGGAGFRFLFAAFLQEASEWFGSPDLHKLSMDMTAIGDRWREFAVVSVRIIKQRKTRREDTFDRVGGMMLDCATREEELFKNLRDVVSVIKT